MHTRDRAASRSTLLRIFRFLLIPVALVSLGTAYLSLHYRFAVEGQTERRYAEQISLLATRVEALVSEITRNVQLLETSPEVVGIFLQRGPVAAREYTRLVTAGAALSAFAQTKTLIEMVYIFVPTASLVVSSQGSAGAASFFTSLTKYKDHDEASWRILAGGQTTDFALLAPTTVTNVVAERTREVLPLVYRRMGRFYTRNLLVVHLGLADIRALLQEYVATEHSAIAILDSGGTAIVSTDLRFEGTTLGTGGGPRDTVLNGETARVLEPRLPGSAGLGFRYIAVVPRSVLRAEAYRVSAPVYALALIGLVASVVAAYLLSLRIYSPIRQLVALLGRRAESPAGRMLDEYEYLRTKVRTLLDSERSLADQIASVAPIVFEQQLLRLINREEAVIPPEVERFLDQHGLGFTHEHFVVAVCDLDATRARAGTEDLADLNAVMARLVDRAFAGRDEVDVRPLHLEPGRVCAVFGLEGAAEVDGLTARLGEIAAMVRADHPELRLYSGLGRGHAGYPGMRLSYREALAALAGATLSGEPVKVYQPEGERSAFVYTIDDEVRLTNHLVAGESSEVEAQVARVLASSAARGASTATLRELYLQLVMTGARVLYARGASPTGLLGPEYRSLAVLAREPDLTTLAAYVKTLLGRVAAGVEKRHGKIGPRELVQYVHEHLSRPLYLDQLAVAFHTTPKYVSRYFKKTVGTPFYRYIETRRIEKACDLLRTTTASISEVGERVGILNRNTFLRVFKKITGLTPSAFRDRRPSQETLP